VLQSHLPKPRLGYAESPQVDPGLADLELAKLGSMELGPVVGLLELESAELGPVELDSLGSEMNFAPTMTAVA
jgi:hypothetical protein